MDSHFKNAVASDNPSAFSFIKNRHIYLTQSLTVNVDDGGPYTDMTWGQYVIYKQSLKVFNEILYEIKELIQQNQDVHLFFYPQGTTTPFTLLQSAVEFNKDTENNSILESLLSFYQQNSKAIPLKEGADLLNRAFFVQSLISAQLLIKYNCDILYYEENELEKQPFLSFLISYSNVENITNTYYRLFDKVPQGEEKGDDILKTVAKLTEDHPNLNKLIPSKERVYQLVKKYSKAETVTPNENSRGDPSHLSFSQPVGDQASNDDESCQYDSCLSQDCRRCEKCNKFYCDEHFDGHLCQA